MHCCAIQNWLLQKLYLRIIIDISFVCFCLCLVLLCAVVRCGCSGPLDEHDEQRDSNDDDDNDDNEFASTSGGTTAPSSATAAADKNVIVTITNELGHSKALESDPHGGKLSPNNEHEHPHPHHAEHSAWFTYTKITLLVIVWLVFTYILTTRGEKVLTYRQIAVSVNETRSELCLE